MTCPDIIKKARAGSMAGVRSLFYQLALASVGVCLLVCMHVCMLTEERRGQGHSGSRTSFRPRDRRRRNHGEEDRESASPP